MCLNKTATMPGKFDAIMPIIVNDLVNMVAKKQKLPEQRAMNEVYDSKLYELLEREETKLWCYSTHMLYSLLEQEQQTGFIVFPDV